MFVLITALPITFFLPYLTTIEHSGTSGWEGVDPYTVLFSLVTGNLEDAKYAPFVDDTSVNYFIGLFLVMLAMGGMLTWLGLHGLWPGTRWRLNPLNPTALVAFLPLLLLLSSVIYARLVPLRQYHGWDDQAVFVTTAAVGCHELPNARSPIRGDYTSYTGLSSARRATTDDGTWQALTRYDAAGSLECWVRTSPGPIKFFSNNTEAQAYVSEHRGPESVAPAAIPVARGDGMCQVGVDCASSAPPASTKKQPGIYTVNRQIASQGSRIVTLTTVELLADGRMKVNVRYRNNGTTMMNLNCGHSDGGTAVILPGGKRIPPSETFCTTQRNQSQSVAPGGELITWAVFPNDAGGAPFSLSWYTLGRVDNITIQ